MTTAGPPVHETPGDGPDAGGPTLEPTAPATPATELVAADTLQQFKEAQRATWALGDYGQVAHDLLPALAERLVATCGITAGQHVLDVAAGAGNVALRAAACGAHVIASDLTPELFEDGQTEAAARQVALDWVEADAEDLPFEAGMFDTVVSCVGAMFAPRHQQAADELVRVCRPGGTVGLVNWTPDGTVGAFLGVFAPYLPTPPAGAQSPALWGDAAHVQRLFGERVQWRHLRRETLRVDHFSGPEHFCAYYKSHFGPTMRAYANVADDPERSASLDREFLAFADRHARRAVGGVVHYDFEYLLAVGTVTPQAGLLG